MKWYVFLGLIAVGTIVYLIVGWLGNKAVDSTENALRAKRLQRQQENAAPTQPQRRLAEQMTPRAASAPVPAQTALPAREQKARFCTACGAGLEENAKFCPMCGAAVERYRGRES